MSYLKEPLTIGKLPLKNRLVMPPMATSKAEENGAVSQGILDYYKEKAAGGYLSLVVIEHSFVAQQGKAHDRQLSVADDALVSRLKELSDLIHQSGSKAVMQINHAGSSARTEVTGCEIVGPSAVKNPSRTDEPPLPKELTTAQIKEIVKSFADAAKRVKSAGFDGVEIHSAHGYLLNQFLSPLTNKRTDEYGGEIANRVRIHLEVIAAVRRAVGDDFPILLRMGATDNMTGGLTLEDAKTAAALFEKAGVSILDISGGMCRYTLPGITEPGYFAPITEALKEAVSIPVILTGGITAAAEAEALLQAKKADLIGVGRAIYKDSGWAKNAMESLK